MLLAATPLLEPAQPKTSIVVKGEPPARIDPPSGCMFESRCRYATELCVAERPMLRQVAGTRVGCHQFEAIC
jgi:oligopeptide/dipeptide ABC transporter ATP-binding protein